MILVQNLRLQLSGNSRLLLSILFVVSLLITAGPVSAQTDNPVKRSQVVEKIDGKKYYIHEIKSGQTVYSIAKAYNVSVEEIYKFNPDARDVVTPSQMLKIPVWLVERDEPLQQEGQREPAETNGETEPEQTNNNKTQQAERKIITHTVEKGETLYSLARRYGARPQEIKEMNPGLVDILQKGQKVTIPATQNYKPAPPKSESEKPLIASAKQNDKDTVVFYTVKPGETLYRIAVNHDIEVDVIIRMNPEVADGLPAGAILKLPVQGVEKKNVTISEKKDQKKTGFLHHKVQQGETLYSLSVKYSVEIEELKKHNPSLQEGLKAGQELRIPAGNKSTDEPVVVLQEKKFLDSLMYVKQRDTTLVPCDSVFIKRSYRVALYMPLYLDDIYEIKIKDYKEEGWPEQRFKSLNYIHFYEGFLLALDSLEKQGLNAEVFVYDTKGSPEVMKKLIAKPKFKTFDLIFGPFMDELVPIVATAAKPHSINVISPVSYEMKQVIGNPHLIKLFPPVNYQINRIVDFVANEYKLSNIVFVYSSANEQAQLNSIIQKMLARKFGIQDSLYPWKTVDYDKEGYAKVKEYLKADKNNLVFCLHKGEARINRFVTRLNGLREDFDITVLGSNEWETYRSIESLYLNNLKYISFTDYLVEYDDVRVKSFVRKFTSEYKTWPHKAAFKGFDVGYFFLTALHNYGINFQYCMDNMDVFPMHNGFDFKQWETNAWQNSSLNIYQYQDYKRVNLVREFDTPESGELQPPEKENE